MDSVSAVLLRGPEANMVRLSKRKNVVDFEWSPELGMNNASEDPDRRIENTTKLFQNLQVILHQSICEHF